MMSDFMFPIYLATNKIQTYTGESEEEQKAQLKTEKFGIKRPAVGQDRPERGKANSR